LPYHPLGIIGRLLKQDPKWTFSRMMNVWNVNF
jgi:hypothetical protein